MQRTHLKNKQSKNNNINKTRQTDIPKQTSSSFGVMCAHFYLLFCIVFVKQNFTMCPRLTSHNSPASASCVLGLRDLGHHVQQNSFYSIQAFEQGDGSRPHWSSQITAQTLISPRNTVTDTLRTMFTPRNTVTVTLRTMFNQTSGLRGPVTLPHQIAIILRN